MLSSLIDPSPTPIAGLCFLLLQSQMGVQEIDSWVTFANNLTVPSVLLFGLYYLYKMKEKTEDKRDGYIKELLGKVDKANSERMEAYTNKIAFINEQLHRSEEERRTLQNKLLDGHK
jgi:hypothetical protein